MKVSYEIGGRRLTLRANVHTWFVYKAEFGRELAEDMQRAIELDSLRGKEPDRVKSSAMYGEECRLFLQILWTFADEGTEGLGSFEDWLESVNGADMVSVVRTVTELYVSTVKPDKRNRAHGGKDGDGFTTEELAEMLLSLGVTISDMRELTVGQALNLLYARARSNSRASGKSVSDPDKQYRILKEIVSAVESGEITDFDPKEYERIKRAVEEWERG